MAYLHTELHNAEESEEEYDEDGSSLVVDIGSSMIKAGFAGDDAPKALVPSITGRPSKNCYMVGMTLKHGGPYVGNAAWDRRGLLTLTYPIEHGIVTSCDDMEWLLRHTFDNELRIQPEEHSILLTETSCNPKLDREKMTQIMFEEFYFPSYYIAIQQVLALYATGLLTATVLDSGHGITQSVPIYEGHSLIYQQNNTWDFAGRDLTDYLRKILNERGYSFITSAEREIVRDIKEKLAYCAQDFEFEMKKAETSTDIEKEYELPDGQMITVESEVLFKPNLIGKEHEGVHKLTYDSIMECDKDIQAKLFENIIVCGGSTLFPGFDTRMTKEISALVSSSISVNVYNPSSYSQALNKKIVDHFVRNYINNYRKLSYNDIVKVLYRYSQIEENKCIGKYITWIGGSMLASSSVFNEMCISRDEYYEKGPSIVHRKCF